jgi:hypothetical protein
MFQFIHGILLPDGRANAQFSVCHWQLLFCSFWYRRLPTRCTTMAGRFRRCSTGPAGRPSLTILSIQGVRPIVKKTDATNPSPRKTSASFSSLVSWGGDAKQNPLRYPA